MAFISTVNSVPSNYSRYSRDFQVLARLYDAVFNNSKLAADMVVNAIPAENFDETLLSLLATTVGFIRKHEYNSTELKLVLCSFLTLLKEKGTKQSIEGALNILSRANGISDFYTLSIYPQLKRLDIYLSSQLGNAVLLKDLFDYILPTGFFYRIYYYEISAERTVETTTVFQGNSSSDVYVNANYTPNAIAHRTSTNIITKTSTYRASTIVPRLIDNAVAEPESFLSI